MKTEFRKRLSLAMGLLSAFVLWTLIVIFVDVQPVGPLGSEVGLAAMNRFFHSLTGVHLLLYVITDWLSLVPLGFVAGFGCLGLVQWIRRKYLKKVDYSLLVLGIFYLTVLAVFVFFEKVPVNYRPILIEGALEASYPSSTTMLVLCVMPTAVLELRRRLPNFPYLTWAMAAFTVFMVLGRLLSGVHWLSDIIGGGLLSGGLVMLYRGIIAIKT